MSQGAKIITIEGTTNSELLDLTVGSEDGQTLILKMARFEITYTGSNFPRMVNIALGNTVSTDHVIDNDVSFNYFKAILRYKSVDVSGTLRNISVTYPNAAYKISGRLNKISQITLLDSNHQPLPGLVYYSLQYQLV